MQGFCQFIHDLVTWVTISSEETLKVVVADVSACSDAGLFHARGFYIVREQLSKLPHNVVPLYPGLSLKSLTTCLLQHCLHRGQRHGAWPGRGQDRLECLSSAEGIGREVWRWLGGS